MTSHPKELTDQVSSLVGFQVGSVSSSSQLGFSLYTRSDRRTAEIGIGGSFTLARSGVPIVETLTGGEGDRRPLGICLNACGSTVKTLQITEGSHLVIELSDGPLQAGEHWTIDVSPDEKYESWEIRIADDPAVLVVCTPGGEISMFGGPAIPISEVTPSYFGSGNKE